MNMAFVVLLDMLLPISTNGAKDMKNHSEFNQLAALAEQNMLLRDKNQRLARIIRKVATRLPEDDKKAVLGSLEAEKDDRND